MPRSVLNALDETGIVTEYIGTGPYKFGEWVEHQYIHITRNDDYQPYGTEGEFNGWSGYKTAATKDIYFDIVTDAATIVAGMQTGEYDATTDITADNIAMFQDNPDFVVEGQECEMAFLIFNKKQGLGANEKMRQAAVNAEDVMKGVYGDEVFYSLYSGCIFSNIGDWYIEAMRASGARTGRILLGHISLNILSPVIVQVSFVFASAIITEAALSFLGVGVPVPEPGWGNILNEGKEVIYKAWWMILFPGLFTALSVLGLNILGDGLRDFLDPHSN